jgi:hypothetical protein
MEQPAPYSNKTQNCNFTTNVLSNAFNLLEIVAHFHDPSHFWLSSLSSGAVTCGYLGSPGRNANRTGRFLAHEIKYDGLYEASRVKKFSRKNIVSGGSRRVSAVLH